MDINGVSAIVTGGGSGLGEATARALAAKGAKVAIIDLQDDRARAVAADIGGIAVRADVTSEADVRAALAAAAQAHGVVRIAVNCAGVAPAARVVGKKGPHPLEQFQKVININLVGTFNVIRLVAEGLVEADPVGEERGVIVNTASVAAFDGQIGQAAYAASKAGVAGMTLPVARDLAQYGVRVCTIAPGLFLTPMLLGLPEEAQKSLGQQSPFPSRLGNPSEYASLAVQIVENPMLNGETIRLDAAIRMAPR
ncbi:SDR family NAD(P)-dependent oxidoreductase [Camelimonas lactis]|uniref:NAD(P)-dependent dehydrogenase (Short-subunit alcohol dehydrogenase family) n=1 Tax=Camelimonas lactis TaxID=659006 RepID=A0A4R2GXK9_9HYPH|nr:SDR family NAD(P)-dependent oxidoreductase [Camelimonas lactis]TCO15972.1 NAD(P)-dependent dehydrogenase (short-subunit alcohol dehydrogenase family) [Camelimonas lactis]